MDLYIEAGNSKGPCTSFDILWTSRYQWLDTDGYSKSNETALRGYPAGPSTDSRALSPVIGVLAPPDGEGSSGNDLSVVSLLLEYPSVQHDLIILTLCCHDDTT